VKAEVQFRRIYLPRTRVNSGSTLPLTLGISSSTDAPRPQPPVGPERDLIRANQLRGVLVTAPEAMRHRLRGLSTKELVAAAARFRPGDDPEDVDQATRFALRSVARRYQYLSEEIAELDAQLCRLVAQTAPQLTSLSGGGMDHAATLLVVAGDNPQRLGSEPGGLPPTGADRLAFAD
jgi:hypothetical protein